MLINLLSSNIHFQILHSLKFESLKVWTLLIHKYIAVRKLNCVFTLYIPLWISWENLINWWRHFSSGDHFVNSHNVFSWRWMASSSYEKFDVSHSWNLRFTKTTQAVSCFASEENLVKSCEILLTLKTWKLFVMILLVHVLCIIYF